MSTRSIASRCNEGVNAYGEYQKALNEGRAKNAQAWKDVVDGIAKAVVEIVGAIGAVPQGQADPANLKAVFFAIDNLGNSSYGSSGFVANSVTGHSVGRGENKCNAFVCNAYTLTGSGSFPTTAGLKFLATGVLSPYSANALADTSTYLSNLPVVGDRRIGDVVAWGMGGANSSQSGHAALYLGGGMVIYAGSSAVKVQTVNYVSNSASYTALTFRRLKP